MTEKRFKLIQTKIIDNDDKLGNMERLLSQSEVVGLLNRLNKENEYFKQYFRNNGIKEIVVGDCKIIISDETK